MLRTIMVRLFSLVFLFVFLTFIGLAMQKSRAGSAALVLSGQRADGAEIEKLRQDLGENDSFGRTFLYSLKKVATFNFGNTIRDQPVMPMVWQGFRHTFVLAFWAAIFALFYGLFMGISGRIYLKLKARAMKLNYFLLSVPIFIVSLLLLWVFSLTFSVFPPGGTAGHFWFVLPALALGIKSGARLALFTDEFIDREAKKPYVLTARASGIPSWKIYSFFVVKNMLLPLLSFWLLEFGSYLAGAAIVETIFSVPGIGSLLLRALMQYDLNLILGALVFIAVLIFTITIIQEILDKIYAKYTSEQAI
ncbi:MAG: ABC transporter permease [Leptospirales bacterium]